MHEYESEKEKKRRAKASKTPLQDEFNPSDDLIPSSGSSQDSSTLASTQSPTGTPNHLIRSLIAATDQTLYTPDASFDARTIPPPPVDEMTRLIHLYLRYLHPIQRLLDENDLGFWKRLDGPLEHGVASLVYAMCTIGALFEAKDTRPGEPDALTLTYYRRTCASLAQAPDDIPTLQSLLILVPFYAISNLETDRIQAYERSQRLAERCRLGDTVMSLSAQDKLSAKDIELRNTWRSLIWLQLTVDLPMSRSSPIELSKDLSGACFSLRAEDSLTLKSPIAESFLHHLCNLMKLYQNTAKIKLPMSPRDVHAVSSILDSFNAWQNALPKALRTTPSKSGSSFSPYAALLDLYFRLGQIFLLNNLPRATRSSPTGLGPRRQSPLRTLATCANVITGTIGDFLASAGLRNYCLGHAIRCLTEAATIQLANTKESDPSISTPAKVNLMKTLWCLRQINFSVPTETMAAILDAFNTNKIPPGLQWTDMERKDDDRGSQHSESVRPRTSSISVLSLDSPRILAVSLSKEDAASHVSAQEPGPQSAYEESTADSFRAGRVEGPFSSPPQEISTSSLLSLSLESPSVAEKRNLTSLNVHTEPLDRETPYRVREYLMSRSDPNLDLGQESREEARLHGRDSQLGDRSRSSSFSVFSPRTESSTSSMLSLSEVQSTSSRPTFQLTTTQTRQSAEPVRASPNQEFSSMTPHSYRSRHASIMHMPEDTLVPIWEQHREDGQQQSSKRGKKSSAMSVQSSPYTSHTTLQRVEETGPSPRYENHPPYWRSPPSFSPVDHPDSQRQPFALALSTQAGTSRRTPRPPSSSETGYYGSFSPQERGSSSRTSFASGSPSPSPGLSMGQYRPHSGQNSSRRSRTSSLTARQRVRPISTLDSAPGVYSNVHHHPSTVATSQQETHQSLFSQSGQFLPGQRSGPLTSYPVHPLEEPALPLPVQGQHQYIEGTHGAVASQSADSLDEARSRQTAALGASGSMRTTTDSRVAGRKRPSLSMYGREYASDTTSAASSSIGLGNSSTNFDNSSLTGMGLVRLTETNELPIDQQRAGTGAYSVETTVHQGVPHPSLKMTSQPFQCMPMAPQAVHPRMYESYHHHQQRHDLQQQHAFQQQQQQHQSQRQGQHQIQSHRQSGSHLQQGQDPSLGQQWYPSDPAQRVLSSPSPFMVQTPFTYTHHSRPTLDESSLSRSSQQPSTFYGQSSPSGTSQDATLQNTAAYLPIPSHQQSSSLQHQQQQQQHQQPPFPDQYPSLSRGPELEEPSAWDPPRDPVRRKYH
ncbi:hypothetical protein BGZ94_008246 [Podila epigama]|nr:hypothetical protein BGZ94_008246 [Podila epigama]